MPSQSSHPWRWYALSATNTSRNRSVGKKLARRHSISEGVTKPLFLRATSRGIRQVYGGLILEAWVSMRKFSGEMFDGAPTVVAMGRQAEFNAMINSRYFTRESPCTAQPMTMRW